MSVLASEARRASRRWTTPVMRVSVAGLVIVALVLVQASFPGSYAWSTGEGGRAMFVAGSWTLLLLLFVLAPTLGALGLEEEQGGARLDLLLLTRIPPWRLFADKVGGRLLLVLALLAAALPFLALTTAYGGVSPWEVVSTALAATHVSVVLALLGGWLSLRMSRGILAAVVAVLVGGALWLALPAFLSWGDMPRALADAWTLVDADPRLALATAGASVPAMLLVLFHGARRVAARRRHPWLSTGFSVFLAGGLLLSPLVWDVVEDVLWSTPLWVQAGAWFAMLTFDTLALVWTAGWILEWASILGQGRRSLGLPQGKPLRLFPVVWDNPIAWREVATRAYGRVALGQVVMAVLLLLGLSLFGLYWIIEDGLDELPVLVFGSMMVAGAVVLGWGHLLTGYLAGRIGADEATQGTLEAITLTTLGKGKLLVGKLAAPAVHGLLPALGGLVLCHLAILLLVMADGNLDSLALASLVWLLELGLLALLVVAGWAALALGGLGLGLLLPRPRWVPVITVTVAALSLPWVVFALPGMGALSLFSVEEAEVAVPMLSITLVVAVVLAAVAAVGWALAWHKLQPERLPPP